MTTRPIVSIIMPVFNEQLFLERAVQSIQNQNVRFGVELIIVDDCSSDKTAELASSLIKNNQAQFLNIKYLKLDENLGNALAFFHGLKAASGHYYHVLDADDYWIDRGKLSLQVEFLEASPELAGCGHRTIVRDEMGGTESFYPNPEPRLNPVSYSDLVQGAAYFHTSSLLFRNYFYDPSTKLSHPHEIFREVRGDVIRMYVNARYGDIAYIPRTMSVYDNHGGGIWTSLNQEGQIKLIERLYAKLEKYEMYDLVEDEENAKKYVGWKVNSLRNYIPISKRPVCLNSQDVFTKNKFQLSSVNGIKTVTDLEKQVRSLILMGMLDEALSLLRKFISALSFDANLKKISFRKVICTPEIDALCYEIGGLIADQLSIQPRTKPNKDKLGPVAFVMSGMTSNGGGMMEETLDFAQCYLADREVYLFSTETVGSSRDIRDYVDSRIQLVICTDTGLLEKTAWLTYHLSRINPSLVFLNPSHHDVSLLGGIRKEHCESIYLINSLDHGIGIGKYSPAVSGIIAKRPYEMDVFKKLAPSKQRVYVPAFTRHVTQRVISKKKTGQTLKFASACVRKYKIEQAYDYQFKDVVPELIHKTGCSYLHVGDISEGVVNHIRKALAKHSIDQDAFQVQPRVPNLGKYLLDNNVDVFLQSFPIAGGKTSIEVLSCGIPIINHDSYLHPMMNVSDMAYREAPCWAVPEELFEIARGIDPAWLKTHSDLALKHFEKHCTVEVIQRKCIEGNTLKSHPSFTEEVKFSVPETPNELRKILNELMEFTVFE
ncbi:glycosyltransferase [Falsihalocynthiibacter sp. S25ZX9]